MKISPTSPFSIRAMDDVWPHAIAIATREPVNMEINFVIHTLNCLISVRMW